MSSQLKVLKLKNLKQDKNVLQVTVCIDHVSIECAFNTKYSPEYIINESAIFQVRVSTQGYDYEYQNYIFIKFVQMPGTEDFSYTIKFTSKALKITDKHILSDDGTWRLLYEDTEFKSFDVSINMEKSPTVQSPTSFAILHEDMELSDFKLCVVDGSVHVHRAVLAACSPVFRRLFKGAWLETTEGNVDISGISGLNLQHLKNYIYLHTLPDTGLEQLLRLSEYYGLPELEVKCVDKIVNCLTAESAFYLLEFAIKNKMHKLLMAILKCVQKGSVDLKVMQENLLRNY